MIPPSLHLTVPLLESLARSTISASDLSDAGTSESFLVASTACSSTRPHLNLLNENPAVDFCTMVSGSLRHMAVVVRVGGLADSIQQAYVGDGSALSVLGSLCEVWLVDGDDAMCDAFLRWATKHICALPDHVQIVPVVPGIGIIIPADGVHAVCSRIELTLHCAT